MQPRTYTALRSWIFVSGLAALGLALVLALRGALLWALVCVVFAFGADAAGRVWSRRCPIPFPYSMRWVLLVPRGRFSPKHLKQVLVPKNGERILEVGPGVGVHALPIASALLPNGILDVLDVQQEMLDDLKRRAVSKGVTNIVATQGDAQALPYFDHSFDAAYLIGVLGEIPDAIVALRELQIDHGGLQAGVAHVLLDHPEIHARFEQMGGIAMAQGVDGDAALVDARRARGLAEGPLHAALGHRRGRRGRRAPVPAARGKQQARMAMPAPLLAQDREHGPRQGHEAVLGPLAEMDVDHQALAVDVRDFQMQRRRPHPYTVLRKAWLCRVRTALKIWCTSSRLRTAGSRPSFLARRMSKRCHGRGLPRRFSRAQLPDARFRQGRAPDPCGLRSVRMSIWRSSPPISAVGTPGMDGELLWWKMEPAAKRLT